MRISDWSSDVCSSDLLSVDGAERSAQAQGSGPVDATFKAIEAVAESGATLQLYSVNAITQGTDSQGEVTVRLEKGGRIVNGNGADTDIVVASAKAYLNAPNLMQVGDRRSVVEGMSVTVRVDYGGARIIKKINITI